MVGPEQHSPRSNFRKFFLRGLGILLPSVLTIWILIAAYGFVQNRIAESVESVGRDLLRELPSLSKGQVVVSGASVNTPVLMRVRERITPHGGQSIDAPDEWVKWFEEGHAAAAVRDEALPAPRDELPVEPDGDILFA